MATPIGRIGDRPVGGGPIGGGALGARPYGALPFAIGDRIIGGGPIGGLWPLRYGYAGGSGRFPIGSRVIGGNRPRPSFSGLAYQVYGNGGYGGPVDYADPLATVFALSWSPPALAPGSDWTFAVRTVDGATGLVDLNTDARVRIVVGLDGSDRSAIPTSPVGLTATPTAGAGLRVSWSYLPAPGSPAATSFAAWVQAGASVDFAATPTATVKATGAGGYSASVAGLVDGTTYAVGVRALCGTTPDPNTTTVTATADATGPAAVDTLTATAVMSPPS